ncbi:MAG TPA: VTT domain-containing protein [Candidatus Polarisedimenticolia bacterium]|nr:VTT domain-containing protein [Candidatus Polarisedimenticolia bacterium]
MDALYGLLTGAPAAIQEAIRWGGYAVLFAIVFTETGLLVGLFLPGDSLLVIAGLVAAAGGLNVWALMGLLTIAAVAGDSTGYAIGHRAGPILFRREQSLVFNPRHLVRTRDFYARYGAKTIVIARFVPIIRTFAPVVAGIGQMEYRRFLFYNVAGGLGWVILMTSAGYLLGRAIPNVGAYVHIVAGVVIVLSLVPIVTEVVRERRRRSA